MLVECVHLGLDSLNFDEFHPFKPRLSKKRCRRNFNTMSMLAHQGCQSWAPENVIRFEKLLLHPSSLTIKHKMTSFVVINVYEYYSILGKNQPKKSATFIHFRP